MFPPWNKSYEKPRQYIKKQRHHFANKVCLGNAMGFPIVMDGCESWTIKKAESQKIDVFGLWCWRRLLRVSWTGFIGRTDVKAEAPKFWPPDTKSQFTGNDPNAGKD